MAFRAVVNDCSLERELGNLRNDGMHCDVFLQGCESDATEIPAHRVVLSARSRYFRAMFSSNMLESRQEHVQLHNIPGQTLLMLVKYAYTSEVNIDEANVESLLEAAIFLDLELLATSCWNFLGHRTDPDSVLLFCCMAELYQCSGLETAKTRALRHFPAVAQTEKFLRLEKDTVMTLIGSDNINVEYEEVVLNAVFSWIRYDPAERTPMLTELLSMIRLAHVDPNYLHYAVAEFIGQVRRCGADQPEKIFQLIEDALCVESQPRESCEFLHVIVGFDKKVKCIDPRSGRGSLVGDLPDDFHVSGCAVMDRSVFVLGTLKPAFHIPFHSRPALYRFHLDLGTWTRLAGPASSHDDGCVVALAGRIYAVGGSQAGSTVECYDPAANSWSLGAGLPRPLYHFGFAVHQGCLFTFGGLRSPQSWIIEGVKRYDPQTDVWTECLDMSGPRYDCSACLGDDGMIYVLGGTPLEDDHPYDQYFRELTYTFDAYSPLTNQWLSRGEVPFPNRGIAVHAVDGGVYVLTAFDEDYWDCSDDGIQAYDASSRTWSFRAAYWSPLSSSKCAVVKFKKTLLCNDPVYPRVVIEGETDGQENRWSGLPQ